MKSTKSLAIIAIAVALAACAPKPETQIEIAVASRDHVATAKAARERASEVTSQCVASLAEKEQTVLNQLSCVKTGLDAANTEIDAARAKFK